MRRRNKEYLLDIGEACKRITRYAEGLNYDQFLSNEEKQDAIIRNIEVIGEAVKKITKQLKNKHPEINWEKISGMRDKLIHFYFGVKLEIVWAVATKEIPMLEEKVKEIIKKEFAI